MQNEKLAPVFLDNQPVNLQEPNPKVSAILTACGLPDATDLKWVQFQPTNQGRTMRPDETLDRTSEPTKPIYLTSAVDGKFAGPIVLRGKGGTSNPQQGAGAQSSPPQGSQKQGSGSGSQPQTQKPGYAGPPEAAQKSSGSQEIGEKAGSGEHGAEWRRAGGRPNPGQRNKPEPSEGTTASEGESEGDTDANEGGDEKANA